MKPDDLIYVITGVSLIAHLNVYEIRSEVKVKDDEIARGPSKMISTGTTYSTRISCKGDLLDEAIKQNLDVVKMNIKKAVKRINAFE